MKKKILSVFMAFLMLFTTAGAFALDASAATSEASSISAKIKQYQKEIDGYQKQIDANYSKISEKTKGCVTFFLMKVVQSDPFILYNKDNFISGPTGYFHVIASDTSYASFFGAYSGMAKPLGTYTYTYNGNSVPDYQEVDYSSYSKEIDSLKSKVSSLQSKVDALEDDRDARISLNMSSMMSGGTLPLMYGGAIAVDYTVSPKPSSSAVVWSSSNKKVATVSKDGVIKGKSAGTATITGKLKVNGSTVKLKVKVTLPLISLKLNYKSFSLSVAGTKQLKTTAKYSKAKYKLYYASSDISVAKVDKNGLVSAVAPGVAYVYAYSDTRVFSEPVKVTVKGTAPKLTKGARAISLLKDSGILPEGTYYYDITDNASYNNLCNPDGIDARELRMTDNVKVGMQYAYDGTNMLNDNANRYYYYVSTKYADIYEGTDDGKAVLIASKTLKFNDDGFTNANGDVFSSKDFRYTLNEKTGWYTISYTPDKGYWYDTNKPADSEASADTAYETAETYDYWGDYDYWFETMEY